MKRFLRILVYLLIAMTSGIIVTMAIDSYEDVAVERDLRKDLEQEIRFAAASFKNAASTSSSDAVLHFLREFSSSAMDDKITAIDPAHGEKPDTRHFTFLFSYKEGDEQVDYYIRNSFLKSQLALLDLPEVIFGLFTTGMVFAGIMFHEEKKKQAQALRLHYKVKHEEIRKVLEEHEALALLGRMAATLAHELKTPVATISNLLQVLPERMDDKTFTRRFVVLAQEELTRTQQLINNLLAYGKEVDASQSEWILLAPFIEETAAKSSLRVEAPPAWEVYGDRFYLGLLFENLLRNSCGAGADTMRVLVQVGPADESGVVAIEIEDNGGGFSLATDLDSLINPFVTCRSSGAGLGLYLAGKIVAAHDGTLALYKPEHGAGVRISLPKERWRLRGST